MPHFSCVMLPFVWHEACEYTHADTGGVKTEVRGANDAIISAVYMSHAANYTYISDLQL